MGTDQARAVAELYRRFGPTVYRRCLRLLSNRESARDATQEIFLKLLKNPESLCEPEAAVSWIFAVTTNHCLNLQRDARRHARRLRALKPDVETAGGGEPFSERHLAAQILGRASEDTRAVAVGVIVEDKNLSEIAVGLGVSRKKVARQLERFLVKAREFLARSAP